MSTEVVSQEARVNTAALKANTGNDYDSLFASLRQNPLDFSKWVVLLKQCDTRPYPDIANAFDAFLARYPYCYGYWQKYAGHTVRYSAQKGLGTQPVKAIYERGVKAVAYSVDMWGNYCNYVASIASTTAEEMRILYARALNAIGTAPTSNTCKANQIWNSVLRFELETTKDAGRVAHIYHQYNAVLRSVPGYVVHFVSSSHPKCSAALVDFSTAARLDHICTHTHIHTQCYVILEECAFYRHAHTSAEYGRRCSIRGTSAIHCLERSNS